MSENTTNESKLKKNLLILSTLLLISTTSIQSQSLLDSTNISYKELTEVAKYIVYKDSATNIFKQYRIELNLKDSLLFVKQLKIQEYSGVLIPNLKKVSKKKDSIIISKNGLLEIGEVRLKSQKAKKWTWLGYGAIIGIVAKILLEK
jgi:hypothetical protein